MSASDGGNGKTSERMSRKKKNDGVSPSCEVSFECEQNIFNFQRNTFDSKDNDLEKELQNKQRGIWIQMNF